MMRIALAEDDPLAARVMAELLGNLVSKIENVSTLSALENLLDPEQYDIVVFDLRLSDSDVLESTKAIRRIKSKFNAPLIVVSGMDLLDPDVKQKCMDAGADAFISKSEAYTTKGKALLMALHSAVLHHPKPNRSPTFMDHVAALERLVATT